MFYLIVMVHVVARHPTLPALNPASSGVDAEQSVTGAIRPRFGALQEPQSEERAKARSPGEKWYPTAAAECIRYLRPF